MYRVPVGCYRSKYTRGRTYKMSHMIADTEGELHAMADAIGVARRWYQGDHYDVTKSKRMLAVKAGAIEIPMRTLACMATNRRFRLPMGTPETCFEIARQRRLTFAQNNFGKA